MADPNQIEDFALEPIASASDGQSSTGRSMADTIAGLNYAAMLRAKALRRRGIRFSQMIPSGPMGGPVCGDPAGIGDRAGGFC